MDPRTEHILEAAIREFIETGEPVSSGDLYRSYEFGIKPAMIRWELNELVNRGYLEQSHHSAGRIPTDMGYEFFADRLLQETSGAPKQELAAHFNRSDWASLVSQMSEDLGVIGAAMIERQNMLFKGMLENFIDNFDWNSREELRTVIRDFEVLEERMTAARNLWKAQDEFLKVFIGKKSPITKSENVSVVAGSYEKDGQRIVICAIGPKRMDYEKTAKIFKGLKESEKRNKDHG